MEKIIYSKREQYPEPEMKKREKLASTFYRLILEPEEYPDPQIIYDDDDIRNGPCYNVKNYDKRYIIDKIFKTYGVRVTEENLWGEFWQLLDYLQEEQEMQEKQKLLPKL
jgi:hypothetical protein